jgi:hypothetical protein
MDLDQGGSTPAIIAAALAIVAFNVPIAVVAWCSRGVVKLDAAMREKDPATGQATDVSYSRITGMIGAVIMGSLFWVFSNILIGTAILNPPGVGVLMTHMSTLFLIGAALFLPYAFNQLKTILQ